ncbi:MAG: rhomboid family intramembrane serine protease [Bacteroidales bacterium]|jgi:membrane associated rhomboid family serine protease|nr:rhomboid family intramembrane serine protease [Bacteroidales bacterium]
MQQYRPSGFGLLPPVVKNLLIINGLFFLATISLSKVLHIDLTEYLGLHFPGSQHFGVWQLVSYMFMHAGFEHILFNMFALWMFGNVLENVWGPKRFLNYYLITGIGAGLMQWLVAYIRMQPLLPLLTADEIHMVFTQGADVLKQGMNYRDEAMGSLNGIVNSSTIGASGAVFGILLAFGMMFPNSLIYLYFAIPVKAKYFVMGYGAVELYLGVSGSSDGVAHFAHLGGMIFGFFVIMYWKKKGKLF